MKRVPRPLIALGFIPIVTWAFVSTLVREIGHGFRYAYLDARMEITVARQMWKEAKDATRDTWGN
jgi:hypothetical protein